MAFDPFSPVLILIHSGKSRTKILPSPILPVLAPLIMASIVGSTKSSYTAISSLTDEGRKKMNCEDSENYLQYRSYQPLASHKSPAVKFRASYIYDGTGIMVIN